MLLRGTIWLIALALAVPVSVSALQSGPLPLGDVVKRPKPAKRAARVIANEDFPERSPEPAPAAAAPADDKASAPAAKSAAATTPVTPAKPNEQGADSDASALLAKRLAEVGQAEESEQKLLERLKQALVREGMSENQRKMLAEALGQSERSLADYRDQKQTLEGQLSARPEAKPPAAADAGTNKPSSPSAPSNEAKPEHP